MNRLVVFVLGYVPLSLALFWFFQNSGVVFTSLQSVAIATTVLALGGVGFYLLTEEVSE